jgi:acyl dehydratase
VRRETLRWEQVRVGDELPRLDVPITATRIVAGAIASRDYQEVHHDRELATLRGSKDIFMNILTTNGYVGRFVTDWAGPEALLKVVDIRLGAPNHPHDTMRMSGRVSAVLEEGGEGLVDVEIVGANGLGNHVTGTVRLALPRGSRGS